MEDGERNITVENGLLAAVAFLLVLVRCIGFGSIPGGFNQDGALAAVDALSLSRYGTDHLGTWLPAHLEAWGYGQMSSLLSYLMVPFVWLWGLSPVTARLPILLASLAGAGALYGIVCKWCGKKAAIFALFFLALNPWHFMQSRWALDCNLFPHMFLLGFLFLILGLEKKKYIYLSMVFFALCMYSYGVAFYMVPVFLLAACVLLLAERAVNIWLILRAAGVYFLLAWPIYGTMLINFMKWDTVRLPFVTMQYFEGSMRSADILFFSEEPLAQLGTNFRALLQVAFLQRPDLIWNAIDKYGTMYFVTMPFVLLGVVISVCRAARCENPRERLGYRLLLAYWAACLLLGLFINSVNVNRINVIFYSHVLFAVIGILFLVRQVRLLLPVALVIYGIEGFLFLNTYFTVWNDQISDYFYKDFLAALDCAREYACDYYYITPNSQYQDSWHVSRVLTWFEMEVDARYIQGETDEWMGNPVPYRYRFQWRLPEDWEIFTGWSVCYVAEKSQMYRFYSDGFVIRDFGNYFVAVPTEDAY